MKQTIHPRRIIWGEVIDDLRTITDLSEWEIIIKKWWKYVKQKVDSDYFEEWQNHKFLTEEDKTKIDTAEQKENKWRPGGYASLWSDWKIETAQLPATWIQWPKWDKWERWEKWDRWEQGPRWIPGPVGPQWPAWRNWRDWAGSGDMVSSNNLSDLVDKVKARENLNVYSKTESDKKLDDKIKKIPQSDLSNYVQKEDWKWLSTNDFTDIALAKLNSINPDLFAKLNSENIFKADQTIKKEWVNLYFNSSSHSSLRYQKDGVDLFALSVWTEKDFKISRFVNGNWVWNVMTINNTDWKIWINSINNSINSLQIDWNWLNVTRADWLMKIEIRDNRILPWCNWYNAEIGWWAFTWDNETFWIWAHKKMVLAGSSIKLLNIKKEPDIYGLSSWDIYLKKFRDDYYYLSLIP